MLFRIKKMLLFLLGRLGSFRVVCRCYLSQQDVYSFGSAFLLDVTVVYYNNGEVRGGHYTSLVCRNMDFVRPFYTTMTIIVFFSTMNVHYNIMHPHV